MQFTKSGLNNTLWVHPDALEKDRKRWIVDATGKTLGRLSVEIAKKLTGKYKTHNCDMRDCGDYVVVINASKIAVTGNKMAAKMYYTHSGYKGHLKETNLDKLLQTHPDRAITFAVSGMVAKNKMRKDRLGRLKVFNLDRHNLNNQLIPMELPAKVTK